ncbi:MAG TPA: hypothetical protein VL854_05620 [Nitrososphaeraceae archaeon]|jgi:hypothetical protein|nr:hypothetical protein [Nitrososphaeraceae archaeon]
MLRSLLDSIISFFIREDTRPRTANLPIYRIYHIELRTIEYGLALQSLYPIEHPCTPRDHVTFTDKGDLTLSTLYEELKTAHSKEIRKEASMRLKGTT